MMGLDSHNDSVKFVALGGVWLDEICAPGKETLFNVPGGSVPFGKIFLQSIEYWI
jgi:hypothetical protein